MHKHIAYSTQHFLDVYEPRQHGPRPVVLFVYGGAWGSGTKTMYGLLANTLAEAGCVVVVPDYTLHPHGCVEEMVRDLEAALRWTVAHAPRYGGQVFRNSPRSPTFDTLLILNPSGFFFFLHFFLVFLFL